jgi:hypothetical protein
MLSERFRSTRPRAWLTAGRRALPVARVVDHIAEYGRSIGREPPAVRYVSWEIVDRLLRPAILPELPRRARRRFEYVIEFTAPLARDRLFPTDLDRILGGAGDFSPGAALLASLRYWACETGLSRELEGDRAHAA